MDILKRTFSDAMKWDGQHKTAISIRDGVLEYYGSELGIEPADKVFTVYRSPATIANVRDLMAGIPLTDEHVDTDTPVDTPVGSVLSAEVIDLFDDLTDARLGIKNNVDVSGPMLIELEEGKRELSLGYKGELHPHSKYDYEQKNIVPHHLAVVDAGRCGSACSFIDRKPDGVNPMKRKPKLHKAFLDADGQPNLQEVVEIAQQLPEALKALPMDELTKVVPALQEIIASSGTSPAADIEEEILDEEILDEEVEVTDEEADEEAEVEKKFADSKSFKDAVAGAVARHTEVIEKARQFVDESYSFKGKSTQRVMRDALAVEHGSQSFSDSELSVAFKLLKKSSNQLQNFGDASGSGLVARVQKLAKGE